MIDLAALSYVAAVGIGALVVAVLLLLNLITRGAKPSSWPESQHHISAQQQIEQIG